MTGGIVTITRVRFLEDDVYEGSIPSECFENARQEVYDELTAWEAADVIRGEGLTFTATGSDWAANPDGSRITDYATGEREETSARLAGFHPRVIEAIVTVVDAR